FFRALALRDLLAPFLPEDFLAALFFAPPDLFAAFPALFFPEDFFALFLAPFFAPLLALFFAPALFLAEALPPLFFADFLALPGCAPDTVGWFGRSSLRSASRRASAIICSILSASVCGGCPASASLKCCSSSCCANGSRSSFVISPSFRA